MRRIVAIVVPRATRPSATDFPSVRGACEGQAPDHRYAKYETSRGESAPSDRYPRIGTATERLALEAPRLVADVALRLQALRFAVGGDRFRAPPEPVEGEAHEERAT